MNTSAFKLLLDAELHKLRDRPIEVELFASRLYTKVLEGAYEAMQPPPPEEQPQEERPHKRFGRPPMPKNTVGTFVCHVCGKTQERSNNRQAICNPKQGPHCLKFIALKEIWAYREHQKGNKMAKRDDFPGTFDEFVARREGRKNGTVPRYATKRTYHGTITCASCGKVGPRHGTLARYCSSEANPMCYKYQQAAQRWAYNEKRPKVEFMTYDEFLKSYKPRK